MNILPILFLTGLMYSVVSPNGFKNLHLAYLTLQAPTLQNDQTHSNNLPGGTNDLFECV